MGQSMRKYTIPSILLSFVLVLILTQVTGCSRTLKELRENDQTVVFEAREPYQIVYQKIIEQARQCYQTGMTRGRLVVQGNLNPDLRKGAVTIAMIERMTGRVRNDISADIEASSDLLTRVTVYHDGTHRFMAENMAKWVVYGSTKCEKTDED